MRLKKSLIICGKIRSGKSHFAKQVFDQTGVCIASFGDYLNQHAQNYGQSTDRNQLQDLGDYLVKLDSVKFVDSVIEFSCANVDIVIFEGVRHLAILRAIRSISAESKAIYLDIPEAIRLKRYLNSGKKMDENSTAAEFYNRSVHPVEIDVINLMPHADYTLHDEAEITICLKEIAAFMT